MVMTTQADLRNLRILVVGGKAAGAQVLRTAFGLIGIVQITVIAESARAIEALRVQSFSAIFCDAAAEPYQGLPFPLAARRTPGVINPMTPLFLITHGARQRQVEQARDTGVTDVLTQPVSAATISRKLEVAMTAPRAFIAASTFFGPDRRTRRQNNWKGADRRTRIAKKTKVVLPEPGSSNDLSFV
jgi:two-component system, chemotaxis family, chemotaxis protein CheY